MWPQNPEVVDKGVSELGVTQLGGGTVVKGDPYYLFCYSICDLGPLPVCGCPLFPNPPTHLPTSLWVLTLLPLSGFPQPQHPFPSPQWHTPLTPFLPPLKSIDLNKPIDKRIYKGTQPTCHDFNQFTAATETISLLVGFSAGQVQYLDLIKKDTSKLFNEEFGSFSSRRTWAWCGICCVGGAVSNGLGDFRLGRRSA